MLKDPYFNEMVMGEWARVKAAKRFPVRSPWDKLVTMVNIINKSAVATKEFRKNDDEITMKIARKILIAARKGEKRTDILEMVDAEKKISALIQTRQDGSIDLQHVEDWVREESYRSIV